MEKRIRRRLSVAKPMGMPPRRNLRHVETNLIR